MDESEIVVFIAVDARRQQPHEGAHARRVIVDDAARDVLGLHRFIRASPCTNRIEFVIPEFDVLAHPWIIANQLAQFRRRIGAVRAVVHRLRIHVLAVAGIGVIGENIDLAAHLHSSRERLAQSLTGSASPP